jgi:hypothetical protein
VVLCGPVFHMIGGVFCGSLDVLGDRVLVNSGDCETWKSLSVSTVALLRFFGCFRR